MKSHRAKYCPICRRELIRTGQRVKTIKAEFTRVYQTCERCDVRVVLLELPRGVKA